MKHLFIFLISFISITTYAQETTPEKRDLSGSFQSLNVSDGIEVILTQGDDETLTISAADEKYLERFKSEVEDGTLKLYYDSKGINWLGSEKRKLKAFLTFKTLEKLNISSGASVTTKNTIAVKDLDCSVTSGAHFTGAVNIKELTVNQNSGSSVDISGTAGELKVETSSGAIFKGFDLIVDNCEAKATSGGGVRVNVNKELSAKANSGGGIRYKGTPVIKDLSVSSGGQVKKAS